MNLPLADGESRSIAFKHQYHKVLLNIKDKVKRKEATSFGLVFHFPPSLSTVSHGSIYSFTKHDITLIFSFLLTLTSCHLHFLKYNYFKFLSPHKFWVLCNFNPLL
jgi:hypothetical protein